jgi:hypothetical protein
MYDLTNAMPAIRHERVSQVSRRCRGRRDLIAAMQVFLRPSYCHSVQLATPFVREDSTQPHLGRCSEKKAVAFYSWYTE